MTQPEFVDWCAFYTLHPFDDEHRFFRPAAMLGEVIGASLAGHTSKADDLMDWLNKNPVVAQYSDADRNSMRAWGLKPPARAKKAKG